jgi:hypothetical protein
MNTFFYQFLSEILESIIFLESLFFTLKEVFLKKSFDDQLCETNCARETARSNVRRDQLCTINCSITNLEPQPTVHQKYGESINKTSSH